VPTLEALAHTVSNWHGNICPILDARKGEIYAALFRRQPHGALERLLVSRQSFEGTVRLTRCAPPTRSSIA